MNRNSLIQQVQNWEKEYKNFMDIHEFPPYGLETKKASLYLADAQGFDSVATTSYQPKTKEHSLLISTNLPMEKYVLFALRSRSTDSTELKIGMIEAASSSVQSSMSNLS